MAIEQKERYILELADGKRVNALCESFTECIQLYGEENIVYIRKLDYDEPKEDAK